MFSLGFIFNKLKYEIVNFNVAHEYRGRRVLVPRGNKFLGPMLYRHSFVCVPEGNLMCMIFPIRILGF